MRRLGCEGAGAMGDREPDFVVATKDVVGMLPPRRHTREREGTPGVIGFHVHHIDRDQWQTLLLGPRCSLQVGDQILRCRVVRTTRHPETFVCPAEVECIVEDGDAWQRAHRHVYGYDHPAV